MNAIILKHFNGSLSKEKVYLKISPYKFGITMTSKLLGSFTICSKKAEKILEHSIYKTQILDVHAQITIDGHKGFLFFQSLAYTTDFK